MVMRNKLYRIFDKYRNKINGTKSDHRQVLRGIRTKNKILNFYLKNGYWPNRKGPTKQERELGTKFENYMSREAKTCDNQLRRIVMATGRKTNNKRKHNVKQFKKDILEFVKAHGRVPATHRQYQQFEGESLLRSRLDYYTKEKNDMTLLGEIYDVDKCHLSKIPSKYRAIINEALDVDKPLIRLVRE